MDVSISVEDSGSGVLDDRQQEGWGLDCCEVVMMGGRDRKLQEEDA